jgi:uncharacterized protein with HEPN domain
MNESRLTDYLDHIKQAAIEACGFIEGLSKADFLIDKRTQNACILSLIVIGEAATKLMDMYPEYVAQHSNIPWKSMRGMRNRVAHGYFDVNLEIVWDTINLALPKLLEDLQ